MATHQLINESTGLPVKPGDMLTSHRGMHAQLVSFRVLSPPSTGRITVLVDGKELEYYPSVYDLKIVELSTH
jgi:hypothetical protein